MKKIFHNYYCIGDSITNGARNEYYRDYVLELNYLFKRKNVIFLNSSVNGETTSEILKRAVQIIAIENVQGIFFLGGTNDTRIPIPTEIFKKNIETLIFLCKKKKIKLILSSIPKIYSGLPSYPQEIGNKFINKYNEIINQLSKKNNISKVELSKLNKKYFIDGTHINNRGTIKIAKLISKKIKV